MGDKLDRSLPFSYGPRGCLGREVGFIPSKDLLMIAENAPSLAYLEMCMILAKMLWKYDIVWFNGDEIDWERDTKGYTLWEKPKLRCIVQERSMHEA